MQASAGDGHGRCERRRCERAGGASVGTGLAWNVACIRHCHAPRGTERVGVGLWVEVGRTEYVGMQASAGGEHGRCERRRCERAGSASVGTGMAWNVAWTLCCMDPLLHGPSVAWTLCVCGPCISPCFGTDPVALSVCSWTACSPSVCTRDPAQWIMGSCECYDYNIYS
jgi:hypothetical protein